MLCWNFKQTASTNKECIYCKKKHLYLGSSLSCYFKHNDIFNQYHNPCTSKHKQVKPKNQEFSPATIDFNSHDLSFITDASVSVNHLGVGIIRKSPKYFPKGEEFPFKYLNQQVTTYPCSTELELQGSAKSLDIFLGFAVESAQFICDNQASITISQSLWNNEDYSKYQYNHQVTSLIKQ